MKQLLSYQLKITSLLSRLLSFFSSQTVYCLGCRSTSVAMHDNCNILTPLYTLYHCVPDMLYIWIKRRSRGCFSRCRGQSEIENVAKSGGVQSFRKWGKICRRVGGARNDDNRWVRLQHLVKKDPLAVKTDKNLDYSSVDE
jgi:hypothetical protein